MVAAVCQENLPRVPKHHELTSARADLFRSCGHLREEIGIDTSEQLDYKPASLFVIERALCPQVRLCML